MNRRRRQRNAQPWEVALALMALAAVVASGKLGPELLSRAEFPRMLRASSEAVALEASEAPVAPALPEHAPVRERYEGTLPEAPFTPIAPAPAKPVSDPPSCCRQGNGSFVVVPASRCREENGMLAGMDVCTAAFKPVCCLRADSTPYWAASQWCDDLGSVVDDALCKEPRRDVCCERPPSEAGGDQRRNWTTVDMCQHIGGIERSEENCTSLLETVCCDRGGRIGEATRGECQSNPAYRQVDVVLCEPVCCSDPDGPSIGWQSRGSCGGKALPHAKPVEEERCEEICCEGRDQTMKREGRRQCAARGGTVHSIVDCGTTLTVEGPDPEPLNGETPSTHVDVEVNRQPPASPYF